MNNTKTAGIVMVVLAVIMAIMGIGLMPSVGLTPPMITGIGFLVIGYVFFTHKS